MTNKNAFTRDGRLRPFAGVSERKVAAIRDLWEAGMAGDRIAAARFDESIATSDAALNAVYLINLQVLDQFDLAPRTWSQIAGVRPLPDFRPAVLQGIFGGFEGLTRAGTAAGNGKTNPAGVAPVVAEGETYPYATLGEVEASYGRLEKHGFKVGWTWEARINDGIGFFAQIPSEMVNVALDTEEWEVYNALLSTNSSRQLTAGPIYDGGANLLANSAIGRRSVFKAVQDLLARTVNGRRIQVSGGYNLVVPIGATPAVEFSLQQHLILSNPAAANRGFVKSVSDIGDSIIASITIVESPYVTGTNWYLLPKPGAVRRPVLELGRLRGNETPELRVNNLTGNYMGGGSVPPFEGSFDNDSIDMRLRYPVTGIMWSDIYVVWSTGVGVLPAE